MAFERKPIYQFRDNQDTGIFNISIERLIYSEETKILYIKKNETGLTSNSTLQDAITNNNIEEISGGSGGGATYFNDLLDVTLSGVADGEVLVFDAVSSKWINVPAEGDRDKTTTPVLLAPASGNEEEISQITIDNYDANAVYYINISGGSYTRNADIISWLLPSVSQDTGQDIGVQAQLTGEIISDISTETITVINTLKTDSPVLAGNTTPEENTTTEVVITNYSISATYNINVNIGTVTRTDDTIEWVIPDATAGQSGSLTVTAQESGETLSNETNFGISIQSTSVGQTAAPALAGSTTPEENSSTEVTITNYSATATYVISVDLGNYSILDSVITWNIPDATAGQSSNLSITAQESGEDISSIVNFGISIQEEGQIQTSPPTLAGDTTPPENADATVTITNYSSSADYIISVDIGTAVRINSTITWSIPDATAGQSGNLTITAQETGEAISDSANFGIAIQEEELEATTDPILNGPGAGYGTTTIDVDIVNYSPTAVYEVTTSAGNATRNTNTISYELPDINEASNHYLGVKATETGYSESGMVYHTVQVEATPTIDNDSQYIINDWDSDVFIAADQSVKDVFSYNVTDARYILDSTYELTLPEIEQDLGQEDWAAITIGDLKLNIFPAVINNWDSGTKILTATGDIGDEAVIVVDNTDENFIVGAAQQTIIAEDVSALARTSTNINNFNQMHWQLSPSISNPNENFETVIGYEDGGGFKISVIDKRNGDVVSTNYENDYTLNIGLNGFIVGYKHQGKGGVVSFYDKQGNITYTTPDIPWIVDPGAENYIYVDSSATCDVTGNFIYIYRRYYIDNDEDHVEKIKIDITGGGFNIVYQTSDVVSAGSNTSEWHYIALMDNETILATGHPLQTTTLTGGGSDGANVVIYDGSDGTYIDKLTFNTGTDYYAFNYIFQTLASQQKLVFTFAIKHGTSSSSEYDVIKVVIDQNGNYGSVEEIIEDGGANNYYCGAFPIGYLQGSSEDYYMFNFNSSYGNIYINADTTPDSVFNPNGLDFIVGGCTLDSTKKSNFIMIGSESGTLKSETYVGMNTVEIDMSGTSIAGNPIYVATDNFIKTIVYFDQPNATPILINPDSYLIDTVNNYKINTYSQYIISSPTSYFRPILQFFKDTDSVRTNFVVDMYT